MSTTDITSRWLIEARRQLRCGRHLVIHGNVRDLCVQSGELRTFQRALLDLLADLGYGCVAQVIPGQGLLFASGEQRSAWERAERGGAQVGPASPFSAAPTSATASGPVVVRPEVGELASVRQVLQRAAEPTAAVVHFADKLFASGEHQPIEERQQLVLLAQAMSEAAVHRRGAATGMRNPLVLVASSIGQVPDWIYRDNPLVAVVTAERPDRAERAAYLRSSATAFHRDTTEPLSEEAYDTFAALTDGMSYGDLDALRQLGVRDQLPLSRIRRLVDRFKYGIVEDPWDQVSFDETVAREQLSHEVIGQERAVRAVLDVLVTARGGITLEPGGRSARPRGVLFFVGPTGVGKTELAKELSYTVFRDRNAFARFDMSEYQAEHSAERLTGAPPSYVGHEAGGQLTNRLKQRPFSLLLFDEVEKAHPRVLDKLLQVLDDGRLTDGLGETVSFASSLIVFTSNIGSVRRVAGTEDRFVPAVPPDADEATIVAHYLTSVRDEFYRIGRPELLGRIGEENIVVFGFLRDPAHVRAITAKFLALVDESARERGVADIRWDDSVYQRIIAHSADPAVQSLGGRALRNFIQKHILPVVNRAAARGAALVVTASGDGFRAYRR